MAKLFWALAGMCALVAAAFVVRGLMADGAAVHIGIGLVIGLPLALVFTVLALAVERLGKKPS